MTIEYRARKLIVGGILLLATLIIYWIAVPSEMAWKGKDGHLFNLSLGLVSGLVVLLFQFVVDNQRDAELEGLHRTRIIGVLESRDKEDYYKNLIHKAQKEILVFGVTASRFLADFADVDHTNDDKKVLLSAIQRGVRVRFLLVDHPNLVEEGDKAKFVHAKACLEKLKAKLVGNHKLEIRYYAHVPTLSMVVADDHFLVGPVFQGKESKHTVTLHAKEGGALARDYWSNFEEEWKKAVATPSP